MAEPQPAPSIDSGSDDPFGSTHWSLVLAAGHDGTIARNALETLCRNYWFPVYGYIRRRARDTHDAEDLTQAFFAKVLEKQTIAAADRNRGRFRAFLLTALKNFLANEHERSPRGNAARAERSFHSMAILRSNDFAGTRTFQQRRNGNSNAAGRWPRWIGSSRGSNRNRRQRADGGNSRRCNRPGGVRAALLGPLSERTLGSRPLVAGARDTRPLKREILIRAGDATFTFTERIRAFSTAAIPEPFGEHQRATRSVPVIVEYGRWAEQSTEGWVDTDWLVVGARLRTLEPTRLRILEHGDEATVTLTTGSEFIVHDEDRRTFGLPDSPDGSVPEDYGVPEEAGPAPQASLHRDGFELTERAHTQQRHFDLALRPGGRGPRLLDGAEHLVVPKSGREF